MVKLNKTNNTEVTRLFIQAKWNVDNTLRTILSDKNVEVVEHYLETLQRPITIFDDAEIRTDFEAFVSNQE